ncbi:hypothetical protein EST38_g5810 [Candolleomyces aberdarensis]|uniref:Uncharacterized protein n=1 Tax=Candolleomyces aberdarensis TaxID=2316362 RepID=A0A4Q2DJG5_9AGAR|nr:hypothetical protein EST38_g5810 [Candolleomyces aberdarensis]
MYSDSEFDSDSGFSSGLTTSSVGYDSDDAGSGVRVPRVAWKCDPAFGVVHQERCTVCRHYMSHFVEGSRDPRDPSFHAAVSERDGKVTMRYLEGIEEGRRVQAEKDKAKLSRYREERDEARIRKHKAEEETRRLRAELAEMRDAFMAMQITYEEQIAALTFGPARQEEDLQALRMLELQSALFAESRKEVGREEDMGAIAEAIGLAEPTMDTSDSSESSDEALESDITSDLTTSESESGNGGRQGTSAGTFSKAEARRIIDQLAQNPTDPQRLGHIREVFLEANSTPRRERTDAHKLVIAEAWKFLGAKGLVSAAPALTMVPEIFVDASTKGIGFIWGNKWEAWKLNQGWRTEGRDMPWAEMVAVELGLRTLIAAGVRSTHIRIRSDNHAVVTGLSGKQMRNAQDALIFQEIQALCKASGIVLMPVWVWTKSNPADALSRGRYPAKETEMDVRAEMPSHLKSFVRNIKPTST